jgi:2-phospho-L-lactate guanylyltransferase
MTMRATAILPIKRYSRAKSRLLGTIDERDRAGLLRAMQSDVLRGLDQAESIERVIVVSGEKRAEQVAMESAKRLRTPIEVLRDPDDASHSDAAVLGIIRALSLGAICTALLPGDCPLLDAAELDGALARSGERTVAVIPDRHGAGTNGLLLCPGDAIGPAFGEGSCERHIDRATRAGFDTRVEELPSLALDLDTPEDLELLRANLATDPARAPSTAQALEDLG